MYLSTQYKGELASPHTLKHLRVKQMSFDNAINEQFLLFKRKVIRSNYSDQL